MTRRLLQVLVASVAFGAVACSGGAADDSPTDVTPPGTPGASPAPVNPKITGSVSLHLTLPGGESIKQVSWDISGPNGFSTVVTSGVETVNALAIDLLISSLPAAYGYRITLSGSSPTGVTCTGSEQFGIVAHETTTVSVAMACSNAPAGSVGTLVNGQSYDCAAITGVTASPTEVSVGSALALAATADAPNMANLTYAWSAPSGSFSAASSGQTSFLCTTPGEVPLTVVAGDGTLPEGAVCNPAMTTMTVTVTCAAAADAGSGGSPPLDAGGGPPPPPPPPPVPATPPWALSMFGAALLALGMRRRGPAARS